MCPIFALHLSLHYQLRFVKGALIDDRGCAQTSLTVVVVVRPLDVAPTLGRFSIKTAERRRS